MSWFILGPSSSLRTLTYEPTIQTSRQGIPLKYCLLYEIFQILPATPKVMFLLKGTAFNLKRCPGGACMSSSNKNPFFLMRKNWMNISVQFKGKNSIPPGCPEQEPETRMWDFITISPHKIKPSITSSVTF